MLDLRSTTSSSESLLQVYSGSVFPVLPVLEIDLIPPTPVLYRHS